MKKISIGALINQFTFTETVNNRVARDAKFAKAILDTMKRFHMRDWGDICDDDKAANDAELRAGEGRVLAKYTACDEKVYINMYLMDGKIYGRPLVMFTWEY